MDDVTGHDFYKVCCNLIVDILIKNNQLLIIKTLVHFNPNLVSMSEIEIENHAAVKWIKSIKAGAAITLMRHN